MKKLFSFSRFQVLFVFALLMILVGGVNSQKVFGSNLAEEYLCNAQVMTEAELAVYRELSLEMAQRLHNYGLVRFSALCDISRASLDEAVAVLEHIGSPGEFRVLQLQDENGEISPETYLAAQEAYENLLAEGELNAATAGIEQGSWNWIGPGNIGGRVRALAVHPSDPDFMWAGGIAGGIWKTTNGGASWQVQDDFMESMAVTAIVVNPQNPEILYAGTGEGIGDSDTISRWIFRTEDSGATWTQLDWVTDTEYVNSLAISHNGATLLAATEDGILRCTEASSVNGCQDVTDWTNVYQNQSPQYNKVLDIEFSPTDSLKAVAGGEGGLTLYSTDGGNTWTSINLAGGEIGAGRVEVAYGPNGVVYASATIEDQGDAIYKSSNNGESYTLKSSGHTYLGGNSDDASALWVDPANSAKVVVGGVNLYRSIDSGVSLTLISDGTQAPDSAFSGHHIAVAGYGDQVIFGTDGGVYRAGDIDTVSTNSGWTELNNNLGITAFYSVAVTATGDIVGGTRGTGTLRHEDGASTEAWQEVENGEGGFVAADPANDTLIYGALPHLQIFRNENGTYTDISGSIGGFGHANFVAPFVLDPHDTDQILAGGDKLWRADNVDENDNPTWTEIKGDIGSNITAITVGSSSNDIWIGYQNGHVYKDINTRVDDGASPLPDRQVTRIVVDGSTVHVMFGGFETDNIWKTMDDGVSWSPLGDLPLGMPVYDLVVNPSDSSDLYIGTEFGVFVSDDDGANWSLTYANGDSPTSSPVYDLDLDGTTLIAATYGRGVFMAEIGASQPSNDDFDSPEVIPADLGLVGGTDLPYRTPSSGYLDTTNATTAGDDPAIANCDIAPGTASVWYEYIPEEDIALAVDTKGSEGNDYNTYLAVWEGTSNLPPSEPGADPDAERRERDRGNLTPIACNDDISESDPDSKLGVKFLSGTTYYIEAGENNGDLSGASVGGNLVLNINEVTLLLSKNTISFSDQLFRTSNTPETITVTNEASSDITIIGLLGSSSVDTTWSSAKSFFIHNDTCSGATLSRSQTCTFDVEFLPWSLGEKTGTITISSDAADQPHSLELTGESIPGSQLLANRSFENFPPSTGLPNLWLKGPGFKLGLDGADDSWAFHGGHSIKLVGDGDLKVFAQVVEKPGSPGDDFSFFIVTRGVAIPANSQRWLMQMMFYNGSTIVENRNVRLKTGTYNFSRLTRMYTASTDYTHIMFRLHFGKSSGTAWVDLASLQWAP